MFLAPFDILGPVAAMRILIVQQSTDAQLLCGRSIPARPVPRAARLMPEYSVQPIAVLCRDWSVGQLLALAVVGAPRIVAALGHTTVFAGKDEAVGAVVELWLVIYAFPGKRKESELNEIFKDPFLPIFSYQ